MGIYLTKKELATVVGYTYRRLHDINMSLPDDGKLFVEGENKKYDLAIFVQRWVRYKTDQATSAEMSLDEVKAIHEQVKTEKTQLEVARMRGSMVDIQDARRLWGDIANTVRQSLIHLPSTVAPMVTMMDNTEIIGNIIATEINKALNLIADAPVPDYAACDDTNESEEDDGEV